MVAILTKEVYSTEVSVSGGRAGHARSSDGILDVPLSRPGSGTHTNPEQLFAAGWAACFQSAFQAVAGKAGADASDSTVTVRIALGNVDDGTFALKAAIKVAVPGMDSKQIQSLADKAHQLCPYSRATRGNIEVDVTAG